MSYSIYCYRTVLCKWQNRAGAGAGDGAGAENKEFRLRNTGFVRDPEVLRVKISGDVFRVTCYNWEYCIVYTHTQPCTTCPQALRVFVVFA